jgi:pimeloyl-ACP methyl ester carboxylesterase
MTPRADLTDAGLGRSLDTVVRDLGLAGAEAPGRQPTLAGRRRRRGAVPESGLATVSLVRTDGVLRWVYRRPPRRVGSRRARRAGPGPVGAPPVASFGFQEVPPNQVIQALESLDTKFTPLRGLRRWQAGALSPAGALQATPRCLLFVHGTFSKSDVFFEELSASKEGKDFLARAEAHYGQVLAFDHPTLSVSPLLNALDLEAALAGYAGVVDVVCHSRGGLVTSWWLRTGARPAGRVVFVGSPLEGTSLAAPARLKDALDYLANVADVIEKAAVVGGGFVPPAAPILGMAASLMKVVGAGLTLGARTPLLDAGVAVVPGLTAQSRVKNNQELLRLHRDQWPSKPECFAVRANFEPGDPDSPWWQFWKRWRKPLLALADTGADPIFDAPNDLVVDTDSMTRLLGKKLLSTHVLDFKTSDTVHHCNYFAQAPTARFLARVLGV